MDDEPHILESLRDTLRRSFDVRTATSGAEGLAMLAAEPREYALIISDMRMPVMSGSVFLRESRRVAPNATRILLTGYADLDVAVRAVNDAALFRFLTKPCTSEELLRACAAGVGQHRLQTAERVLLEQTLKGSVQALADVLALASAAAFGRSQRVKRMVVQFAQALELHDCWEIEVSALLVHVGAVVLPDTTAEKLYAGTHLSANEQAMVERVPELTRQILGNIPRLEGVLAILADYQRPYGEVGAGPLLPLGSRILRIALDHDVLEEQCGNTAVALAAMRGLARSLLYDPDLLEVFARVVGDDCTDRRVVEISLVELRPGMVLADNVRTIRGTLVIARGQTVTGQQIERLANLEAGYVREPLLVRLRRAQPQDTP
ncbi:MAG: HD domain-containing phosphohydrolase [Solirubrobacteraceae bacterium]